MKRLRFVAEINAELVDSINALAARFETFGYEHHEVVENCLFSGIAKTRERIEQLERDARESQREARRLANA